MKLITGNTYPVRDAIKALGGRWDSASRGWMVPDDKAEAAAKLVAAAPRSERRRYECPECGDMVMSGTSCWETGITH